MLQNKENIDTKYKQQIELLTREELVEHLYKVSIEFLDENGINIYRLKGLCDKDKMSKCKEQNLLCYNTTIRK